MRYVSEERHLQGSEILTAVKIHVMAIQVTKQCILVDGNQFQCIVFLRKFNRRLCPQNMISQRTTIETVFILPSCDAGTLFLLTVIGWI
jgi:hypothetical protein